jgi:DNA-binding response OmpR family regulator
MAITAQGLHVTDARILVVDEAASTVLRMVEQLQQEGFRPLGVTSGAQAIDAYKAQSLELVLIGMSTDGMSGIDVLRAIMLYDPEALVVMMSANATAEVAVEALRSGATEFVIRPWDAPELTARLMAVLERFSQMGLRGNLRDLSLSTIVSVNCNEYNQAELRLRRRGQVGVVYFDQGAIVHASLDDDEGEAAIYELLTWEDGSFVLRQGVPAPKHTVQVDWAGLLLEGMRRIDESSMRVELDPGEETRAQAWPDRMATALKAVQGVESVVVSSPGGELLAQAASAEPVMGAGLTALVAQRALGISSSLNAGAPRHTMFTGRGGRFLVVPYKEDYVGLWLSKRHPPESIMLGVTTVMRRYRRLRGEQR